MISVAIPAFKSRFLREAIESVLRQTYSDFELIIVNDASPDDIKTIVNTFKDDRIRYFENSVNLGRDSVARNWNECLRHATGDLFVIFSDDDLYLPAFLNEMNCLSTRYPAANIFHCGLRIIDDSGNALDFAPQCAEFESGVSFIWHRISGYRLHFASDFCCRTNELRKIGGFVDLPQGWGSDDLTWATLATHGGIGYTPKVLFNYRRSEITISQSGSYLGKLRALNRFDLLLGEVLARAPSISPEDRDLIMDASAELPHWIAKRKADQLVRRSGKFGIAAFIKVIFRWFKYRRECALSSEVLLRALSGGVRALSQERSG